MPEGGFEQTSYLAKLSARMRRALAHANVPARKRHVQTILSFQKDNGGFAGRRGGADLYYTGFAVRALHALDVLEHSIVTKVLAYLACRRPRNAIDQLNLLNSLLVLDGKSPDREALFGFLERFRMPDGGYGKTIDAEVGSTYHTFLAALCYDLIGERPPDLDRLQQFLERQSRADGGFCDAPTARYSNTNATAAGLSTDMLLRPADPPRIARAAEYLLHMWNGAGGWLATRSAPFPDLLSTYTALMTLKSAGMLAPEMVAGAAQFARSCECEGGGFRASPVDDQADTEYTFYGLGILALAFEKADPSERFWRANKAQWSES
ncbi:MAG: terpene cyclase/mutase family protein [Planctomycetes bacterium]|nr:terpene cyclase/mutase family protein [Planctomycetota bacterium]